MNQWNGKKNYVSLQPPLACVNSVLRQFLPNDSSAAGSKGRLPLLTKVYQENSQQKARDFGSAVIILLLSYQILIMNER